MTKKQNRSLGFGKRTLSVLLAVLMIVSLTVVSMVSTATAADTKTIYVGVISYLTLPTGNYKVHYWGSGEGDAGLTSLGKDEQKSVGSDYWGGAAQTFHMYTAQIPAGATGFKVRNGDTWFGGDGNPASNDAAYIFEYSNAYNAYYDTHGEGGESGPMTYTAPVNTNNNDNKAANLFWATATYYDYLSDEELSNTKWLKPIQAGTGFNGSRDEWYPFYQFNRDVVKGLADSNSSWALPLYFGNFCNVSGAYDKSHHPGVSNGFNDATSDYNVTRFKYAPNNSNSENVDSARTGGGIAHQNESYQGLMNSSLDSNGNLMLPGGSAKAPYFDTSALEGKAKVVKSSFPFTVSEKNGYKYYEFNSANAKDNVYFTWNTSGSETYPTGVNYGAGTTYGVKDGISRFMNGGTSGYGIFPFNNASNNYKGTKTNANENLNYGFGIKTQVKFRVPAPNESAGVNTALDPVYFDFTGDDDLWMYITDESGNSQLVLDMGGDHKESHGRVNFNNLTATVDKTGTSGSSATKNFTFDYSQTYTMTVFYMERGLIESNCKMEFTMTPLGNNFIVTEKIDTANVNEGIKDVVSEISEFGFNPYDDNTAVTDSDYADFTLGNGGRMDIPHSILGINSQPNVKQYKPSNSYLSYSTDWTYWDNVSNNTRTQLDTGTTSDSSKHTMINASGNEYDYAELQVDYVNTPNVGTFTVEKKMAEGAIVPTGKTFPATIYLKFKSDADARAYTLVDDDGNTCTNGKVNLVPGETISFSGIPTGTRVYVVEDSDANYTASYDPYDRNHPFIVGDSSGNITVINTPNESKPTTATVSGIKKFDDTNYTGNLFTFVLEGVPRFPVDADDAIDTSSTHLMTNTVTNGAFSFSKLNFTAPGVYRYHVYEDMSSITGATYSSDIFNNQPDYLVSITVRDVNFKLVADAPVYYDYSQYEADGVTPHAMSSADFSNDKIDPMGMIFYNQTQKGSITINKTNQSNQKVNNVIFKVYPVSDEYIDELNRMTDDEAKYEKVLELDTTPDTLSYGTGTGPDYGFDDGVAKFDNLPIYKSGYQTSSAPEYQKYVMIETNVSEANVPGQMNAKYNLNKTVHVFSFPLEGKYHFTYDYVNGVLKAPNTAGPGMTMFKIIGALVAALGVLSLGGYVLYTKRSAKRKAVKHDAK